MKKLHVWAMEPVGVFFRPGSKAVSTLRSATALQSVVAPDFPTCFHAFPIHPFLRF
jgi:hypothetical protein